jgi:hypothetical protein
MPSSYSLLAGRVGGLGKGNLVYPKSYGTIQRESIEATLRMLTEFGYQESDLPAGGKLIEI